MTILERLRSMLGSESVVEAGPAGIPRVAPRTTPECALVLRTAAMEKWTVRIEGAGHWSPADAPADLAVITGGLNRIPLLDPADLVATVGAGVALEDLRTTLADQGVWVAIDAPGVGRTVGSVVATGTAGSLRTGFGPVRDHVLGLSLVTGDGRVLSAGGRVVKNVAGFDITKLATGSFGGFGIITSVHLRLRAVPRADVSLVARGPRDRLLQASQAILETGVCPASLDMVSPGVSGHEEWTMATRLVGSEAAVEADLHSVTAAAAPRSLHRLHAAEGAEFWRSALASATDHPCTVRLGTLPTALADALDMITHHLDDGWLMAHVRAGIIRWSGDALPQRLRLLRHAAAQREMPITLERAHWTVRESVGHFGAYREGAGRLISSLRKTFDPTGVLVVPIDVEDGE